MKQIAVWMRKQKKQLIRLVVLLVLASLIGAAFCVAKQDTFLPSLNGKGYKIQVSGGEAYCTIGRKTDNLLMRLSPQGELLSYYRSKPFTYVEEFRVYGDVIYGILTNEENYNSEFSQSIVRFSTDRKIMKPEVIVRCDPSQGTHWKSIAVDSEETIKLAGFADGKICTAEYRNGIFENSLGPYLGNQPAANIDRVLRLEDGDLAWIDMSAKKMNTFRMGEFRMDDAAPVVKIPNRMSYCDGELFVSDSTDGSIYRVPMPTDPEFFHSGKAVLKDDGSGERLSLASFSVYGMPDHNLYMAGLWSDGKESRVITDAWEIREITSGQHVPLLYWQHFWPAVLAAFVILLILSVIVEQIFSGRRIAVRLLLCEIVAALLLLIVVTVAQYRFNVDIIEKEPQQQMKLMAGSVAMELEAEQPMTNEELQMKTLSVWDGLQATFPEERQNEYRIQIVWKTGEEYTVGYDPHRPTGFRVVDMKDESYAALIASAIAEKSDGIFAVNKTEDGNVCHCLRYFTQGDREGCVVVSLVFNPRIQALEHVSGLVLLTVAICPLVFLVLVLITLRLLAPLDRIQKAMEQFHSCGGGNQIDLRGISRTELYDISRVFNKLSRDTKVQMNELHQVNRAYSRMVPEHMLRHLGIRSVNALKPGRTVERQTNVLIAAAADPDAGTMTAETISGIVDAVGVRGGFVVDYNEHLNALTALFPTGNDAMACGHDLVEQDLPVLPTVLEEPVSFGVFGGDHLLYPAALTFHMTRRMAAIARIREFGARMIRCGTARTGLRLMGWDGEMEFYEEVEWHSPDWKIVWREAEPHWQYAMDLYRRGSYVFAARMFAKVLQLMPEDTAAKWYLYQCEKLRNMPQDAQHSDLLWDWEEGSR